MSAELTDPAYSIGTRVQDRVWRGLPYSDEIEPLLVKLGHGVGDDVKDWQLADSMAPPVFKRLLEDVSINGIQNKTINFVTIGDTN